MRKTGGGERVGQKEEAPKWNVSVSGRTWGGGDSCWLWVSVVVNRPSLPEPMSSVHCPGADLISPFDAALVLPYEKPLNPVIPFKSTT
jgi:hypothetical protein